MAQIKLNVPDEVHKRLKELAERDERSLNNYITRVLKRHIEDPGILSTPAQSPLYYPPGVRSPIPEPPYKVTSNTNSTQFNTNPTQQLQQEVNKPRRKSIIGGPPSTTISANSTSTNTKDGHKKHPMLWLDENNIDPNDISESAYDKLHTYYPDIEIKDFINYQHDRQNRYVPNPNDPYDPTINNPYLKNNNT